MPRMQPDDVADFLAQPHIGVLASHASMETARRFASVSG